MATPNTKLAGWFELSGLSQKELARQVIRRAHARGERHVCTDASRVHHWFAGQQPRHPVPAILSEIFTERFGHPVTIEDLGLQHEKSAIFHQVDLPWDLAATVNGIDQFTRSDLMLNRRDMVVETSAVVAGSALIGPLQGWLTSVPSIATAKNEGRRIGMGDVEEIEQTLAIFHRLDFQHGGGKIRKAVVAYLNEVNNLVRGASCTEKVRRRALSALSDLAGGLAGWMSFDIGLHATAQRYFILGVHAAQEAGDQILAADTLACMARQMRHLARPKDALDLLQLAEYGSRNQATPTLRAMLQVEQAQTLAHVKRIQDCHRAGAIAQQVFTSSPAANDPAWLGYFDEAELLAVTGAAYRDLAWYDPSYAEQAASLLAQAVDGFDPNHIRSRALALADQASAHALQGDYAHAHTITDQALLIASRLNSTRVNDRFKALRGYLAGQKHREVHELRDKLTTALVPA